MRYIVVAMLMGAALVGCGSSNGKQAASSTSRPTAPSATTAPSAPSAASGEAAQVATRLKCSNFAAANGSGLVVGAKATSSGKCGIGPDTINIAVYSNVDDRKRADAVMPTTGCQLMKALGVKDVWTVESENWTATTTSETTARAIAPKAGVKPVHVHCP